MTLDALTALRNTSRMTTFEKNTGPVEVWLTQGNMAVSCRVVYEDETTELLDVDSLSMRGAQREMTGWFLRNGYVAAGRWDIACDSDDGPIETVRRFKPALSAARSGAGADLVS